MRKNKKILTHIEETVYNAIKRVINQESCNGVIMSDSAYVRKAVIKDLVDRGLLTNEMVVDLA